MASRGPASEIQLMISLRSSGVISLMGHGPVRKLLGYTVWMVFKYIGMALWCVAIAAVKDN